MSRSEEAENLRKWATADAVPLTEVDTINRYAALVEAARRAYDKGKSEYDRQVPDADPEECWAEFEALADALAASKPAP